MSNDNHVASDDRKKAVKNSVGSLGRLLNIDQVCEWLDIHRSHLNTLRQTGVFPKPLYISKKNLRWPAHEIELWLKRREGEII